MSGALPPSPGGDAPQGDDEALEDLRDFLRDSMTSHFVLFDRRLDFKMLSRRILVDTDGLRRDGRALGRAMRSVQDFLWRHGVSGVSADRMRSFAAEFSAVYRLLSRETAGGHATRDNAENQGDLSRMAGMLERLGREAKDAARTMEELNERVHDLELALDSALQRMDEMEEDKIRTESDVGIRRSSSRTLVRLKEMGRDCVYEIPTTPDGHLRLAAVRAIFPLANALKFVRSSSVIAVCSLAGDCFEAPEDGWGGRVYTVNNERAAASPQPQAMPDFCSSDHRRHLQVGLSCFPPNMPMSPGLLGFMMPSPTPKTLD